MTLLLTGCGAAAQKSSSDTGIKAEVPSASADIFAMDTYMTVTCYGERCEEAVETADQQDKPGRNRHGVGGHGGDGG